MRNVTVLEPMSKAAMLRQAVLQLLREHERDGALPTSNRFLFYELVQRGIISKHPTGKRRADQDANEALTQLRESGAVPWDWIVDETRSLDDRRGFRSIKDGALLLLDGISLDPWQGHAPIVLTESRSLAGVLRSVCAEYGIMTAATNGQCGGFLHTVIAPSLYEFQRVLYFGDWDLAGNQIETNTQSVLERIVGSLFWERLALTTEQVELYDLPKIIKHDRRYSDGYPHEAVETEALSQNLIVQLLRDRLDYLLPEPLADVEERAVLERDQIKAVLSQN
jgi:hypothetical protein